MGFGAGQGACSYRPRAWMSTKGHHWGVVYSDCVPVVLKPRPEGSLLHLRILMVPSVLLPW